MSTLNGSASGDLAVIAAHLDNATGPEAVFGELHGTQADQLEQIRRRYWQLALLVHPDRHANDRVAHAAFVALQRLYEAVQAQIRAGHYGQPPASSGPVRISTRRRTYVVGDRLAVGDLATLYTCTAADRLNVAGDTIGCILKVASDAQDDDLLGGDPLTGSLPPRVPAPIQTYLQSALWTSAARTDAAQLYRDFSDLLADLWGRRKLLPFAMPARR